MITEQLVFWVVVVALFVNLGLTYLVLRRSRTVGTGAANADAEHTRGTPSPSGDGLITCPKCETENEAGYRYCRSCVGELPASIGVGGPRDSPAGRMTG